MRKFLLVIFWGWICACLLTPEGGSVAAQERQTEGAPASSPEALRMYADAASYQKNEAFELAAEEWEKFVQKFPKDPLAGKAQYYAGVCRLQLKDYDRAVAHFTATVANHPKFELAEDARFNLGAPRRPKISKNFTPRLPRRMERSSSNSRKANTPTGRSSGVARRCIDLARNRKRSRHTPGSGPIIRSRRFGPMACMCSA
jgi:tetratricopeptide (TPR) repeat protein